ncbi:Uu.00g031310.m01.CDS01 [Anthostomella pinea]|uniref:Uu.00g031310.m01.CDS01 n=1 Tax=Anthostomella pinea TaxID=933095 RepID=A0AAI8V8I2_9PEZI|nr:Uu.00g031310.m01.CDS01 [Anthostomella pinea]
MATSREERMQQRMRGAGLHEAADDSFGLFSPAAEPSSDVPILSSQVRSEPNTSAKRRRLSRQSDSRSSQPTSSASRASARLSAQKPDPYNILEEESTGNALRPPSPSPLDAEMQDADSTLESVQAVVERPVSRSSIASRMSGGGMAEEVTESPAAAPGSGHRRRIRVSSAATQSAKLQRAVMEQDAGATGEFTTSSPLARKIRLSGTTTPGAVSVPSAEPSAAQTMVSPSEALEGSSPLARRSRQSGSTATTGSARSTRSQNRRSNLSTVVDPTPELSSPPDAAGTVSTRRPQPKLKDMISQPKVKKFVPTPEPQQALEEEQEEEGEGDGEEQALADDKEAEEIDVHEAARRIGRKRPRVSPVREESPELHSQQVKKIRPVKKARAERAQDSPAKQSQPKAPKGKKRASSRRQSDREGIPITVYRYTKLPRLNEEDTDEDILNADIPYSNSRGVSVVNVLHDICDETLEKGIDELNAALASAEDAATRTEFRTKLRALEAFRGEMGLRLEEHGAQLDNMHALQKRVRAAQREKVALRTEILRIRTEREQVALKMDAVRVRHETANKEMLHQLGLSSTMDDIELAIETGKVAPDPSPSEQKAAELANLELLICRVAGQASAAGDGGGNLKQIKDFNAFLERAAVALEGR